MPCWTLFCGLCEVVSKVMSSLKPSVILISILWCCVSPINVPSQLNCQGLTCRTFSLISAAPLLKCWTCQTSWFKSANTMQTGISGFIILIFQTSRSWTSRLCSTPRAGTLLKANVVLLVSVHPSRCRLRQVPSSNHSMTLRWMWFGLWQRSVYLALVWTWVSGLYHRLRDFGNRINLSGLCDLFSLVRLAEDGLRFGRSARAWRWS